MGVISAPEPLGPDHAIQHFDCARPSLNDWLKKKAIKAQKIGGSARTYVVCAPVPRVIGYYALAAGSVNREDAPRKLKRNMPEAIPVVLIGRIAVDLEFKGQGVGSGLLKDARQRIVRAAKEIGVKAILVHALDEQARDFYLRHGFYESPTSDLTLMVTIEEVQKVIEAMTRHQNV
jgi:GNAT superfamily N-acetyltransferase